MSGIAVLMRDLRTCSRALRRSDQARARLRKAGALNAARDWTAQRRARTRHLIELGGIVVKAGLVERLEDDRATVLGALLALCDLLDGAGDDSPATLKARWRRRGLRAFDADAAAKAAGEVVEGSSGSASRWNAAEGGRKGGKVAMPSS